MSDENASPKNYKSTPPTNKKVRNPFDKALIGRLHNYICSPGMCKMYKKKSNGLFRWDIDQACCLVPQDIVPCNSQFEPSPDPALERIAEEATEKFFSQEMVMPSPLESSKKVKPLRTSYDVSVQFSNSKETVVRNASAQTILTLPPELPQELEIMLAKYCTFTAEHDISDEYEVTANGLQRRKLMFEEQSDAEPEDAAPEDAHAQEIALFTPHTPVTFSPEIVSRDLVAQGMKRTFGTPLKQTTSLGGKYRNKIFDNLDGEPFSPIQFQTPKRAQDVATPTSLVSTPISPVRVTSSDEEKNIFTSPESEAMATCLDCIMPKCERDERGQCFCKITPDKLILKRSASLKESPKRKTNFSFSEKRSLSMSSLHRSRSVQKLDFSMDMSVDGSLLDHSQADSESSPAKKEQEWSLVEESAKQIDLFHSASNFKHPVQNIDETPVKTKNRTRTCQSTKIRTHIVSPLRMSLDNSTDELNLEHKKVDFNNIDLKQLTDSRTQFDSTSFKRVDSGFTENTFYASSYYESAIKPSELTVTTGKELKELSNVNWMRVDSGFNENSGDSALYPIAESKQGFHFSEARLDKENDFKKFLDQTNKNEAMSMSDIFNDDMTFNCNFSSTPSKNKPRSF